jgi:hypothetical protein
LPVLSDGAIYGQAITVGRARRHLVTPPSRRREIAIRAANPISCPHPRPVTGTCSAWELDAAANAMISKTGCRSSNLWLEPFSHGRKGPPVQRFRARVGVNFQSCSLEKLAGDRVCSGLGSRCVSRAPPDGPSSSGGVEAFRRVARNHVTFATCRDSAPRSLVRVIPADAALTNSDSATRRRTARGRQGS